MRETVRLGRVLGVEIGVHWTVLLTTALIAWTLAASVFPSTNPGLGNGWYVAMAIVAIIATSYCRSRDAMKRARMTGRSATLHRWRKELKTLWYQLRLARPLLTGVAPLLAELDRLETQLGDDHNLVVLAATLRGCRPRDRSSESRSRDHS